MNTEARKIMQLIVDADKTNVVVRVAKTEAQNALDNMDDQLANDIISDILSGATENFESTEDIFGSNILNACLMFSLRN